MQLKELISGSVMSKAASTTVAADEKGDDEMLMKLFGRTSTGPVAASTADLGGKCIFFNIPSLLQ